MKNGVKHFKNNPIICFGLHRNQKWSILLSLHLKKIALQTLNVGLNINYLVLITKDALENKMLSVKLSTSALTQKLIFICTSQGLNAKLMIKIYMLKFVILTL